MSFHVGFAFNIHDSSVVIANDEEILLVLEAERFFRRKKAVCTAFEMETLIEAGLTYCGLAMNDISLWATTAFENRFFLESKPCEFIERRTLNFMGGEHEVCVVNHHLAHAGSALAMGLKDAAIYVSDGGGDFRLKNMGYKLQNGLFNNCFSTEGSTMTGTFYQHCSRYLFGQFNCEGSFMALCAYGEPVERWTRKIAELIDLLGNMKTSDAVALLSMEFGRLEVTEGIEFRNAANFAASVQSIFAHQRKKDIERFLKNVEGDTGQDVVLAGGTCLNVTFNRKLKDFFPKNEICMAPCCDDTGQALGALLVCLGTEGVFPVTNLPFIGRGHDVKISDSLIDAITDELVHDQIVAFHYGREEVGPRALGHRSLLCRPDRTKVIKKLSREVKGRAWYRPVAPMVLEDQAQLWFDGPRMSPYMLTCSLAREKAMTHGTGVIHFDGTARLQTVKSDEYDVCFRLLKRFWERTGLPLLANTSLNGQGQPICSSEEDTRCFFKEQKTDGLTLFLNGTLMHE